MKRRYLIWYLLFIFTTYYVIAFGSFMRYSKRFRNYINHTYSLSETWENIFGTPPREVGNEFCPFHVNTNTPAGKVYGNFFRCFVCDRTYGVFDLLYRFDRRRLESLAQTVMLPASDISSHVLYSRGKLSYIPIQSIDTSCMTRLQILDILSGIDASIYPCDYVRER